MIAKDWIRRSDFQFGCLIETRVKEGRMKRILAKVVPGWSYVANYEYNRLGRLWIVWSSRVRVTPLLSECSVGNLFDSYGRDWSGIFLFLRLWFESG